MAIKESLSIELNLAIDGENKRLERTRRSVVFIRSCVGEPLKRNVILLLLQSNDGFY